MWPARPTPSQGDRDPGRAAGRGGGPRAWSLGGASEVGGGSQGGGIKEILRLPGIEVQTPARLPGPSGETSGDPTPASGDTWRHLPLPLIFPPDVQTVLSSPCTCFSRVCDRASPACPRPC